MTSAIDRAGPGGASTAPEEASGATARFARILLPAGAVLAAALAALPRRSASVGSDDSGAQGTTATVAPRFTSGAGPVGTNITAVNDYSGDYAFLDRMKTARPWAFTDLSGKEIPAGPADFDEDGWPVSLPPGASSVRTIIQAHYPSEIVPTRRFVILYTGKATFDLPSTTRVSERPGRIVVEVTSPAGFWIVSMREFGRSRPRVRIVREDHEKLLLAGEVFPPVFLERLSKLSALRFMDWGNTNATTLVNWEDRTKPGHFSYNCSDWHVPYEVMIQLCNRIKRHCYVCVPHLANDQFATSFAELLRDNLDPQLLCYVELGNELWNGSFKVAKDYEAKGTAIAAVDWHSHEYSGYRAAQVARLFDAAYRSKDQRARLRNVWGMFTAANFFWDVKERGALWGGNGALPATGLKSLRDVFDCSAGTGYFGGDMFGGTTPADRAIIFKWMKEDNYAAALKQWRSGGYLSDRGDYLDGTFRLVEKMAAWNRTKGLETILYESGSHMVAPYEFGADRDQIIAFYGRLHQQPEVGKLYTDALRGFARRGVRLNMNFTFVGKDGGSGYWGALEYTEQPPTPRWQALVDFQANPSLGSPAPSA